MRHEQFANRFYSLSIFATALSQSHTGKATSVEGACLIDCHDSRDGVNRFNKLEVCLYSRTQFLSSVR